MSPGLAFIEALWDALYMKGVVSEEDFLTVRNEGSQFSRQCLPTPVSHSSRRVGIRANESVSRVKESVIRVKESVIRVPVCYAAFERANLK